MLFRLLTSASLLLPLTVGAETITLKHENRFQSDIAQELNTQLSLRQRRGDKVHLISRGQYGLSTRSNPPWRVDFQLPIGGMFEKKPAPLTWQTFRIRGINERGLALDYEYGINHRSQGNDLLIIDKGQVELSFTP